MPFRGDTLLILILSTVNDLFQTFQRLVKAVRISPIFSFVGYRVEFGFKRFLVSGA